MRRLKALENENGGIKKIAADLILDEEKVQHVIRRRLWGLPKSASWFDGVLIDSGHQSGRRAAFFGSMSRPTLTSPAAPDRPRWTDG